MEYEVRTMQRGQVYWIKDYDDEDIEEDNPWQKKRPAVILSSNALCDMPNNSLTVAWLTTKYHDPNIFEPQVYSTGKKSWVRCDQIETIRREWVQEYLCTLTDYEMSMVEAGVHASLDLCPARASSEREIATLKEEKSSLEAEISMWKRLYEKTMEHLIEQKFNNDVLSGMSRKKNIDVRIPKMIPDEPEEEEVLPPSAKAKVNVNTASAVEINATTGLSLSVCYGITGYRKKIGLYKSGEDLLAAPRFNKYHLEKYGDKFCYE